MEKLPIENVSDTAFWVAVYRAQESARPDALFRDPLAAKLAGERGQKVLAGMGKSAHTAWSVVTRTMIIDDYLRRLVAAGEIDTVVNLGAGLDTRPYRLDLPTSLRCIEVDYAPMIDFKNRELASDSPRCRLERVAVDLGDGAARKHFLDSLASAGKVLVLTEGVLPYLEPEQVSALARDLRDAAPVRHWIVDYYSPALVPYINSKKRQRLMRNAPFRFFPADWIDFYRRVGWRPRETRYLGEESEKVGRPFPLPWFAKLFVPFMNEERKAAVKRNLAYVLLEKMA